MLDQEEAGGNIALFSNDAHTSSFRVVTNHLEKQHGHIKLAYNRIASQKRLSYIM